MKMMCFFKKCIGSDGVYLDKDIHMKLTLKKGKHADQPMGSFQLASNGTCQLVRKVLLYMGIALVILLLRSRMRSK